MCVKLAIYHDCIVCACRLQHAEAELLSRILEKVCADQDREAAANRKTAQILTEAAPARPSGPPADGTDADELLSTVTAKGAHVGLYMTFSGKESLWLLSRQGHDSAGDVAADMIRRRQQQAGGQAMWLQDYIASCTSKNPVACYKEDLCLSSHLLRMRRTAVLKSFLRRCSLFCSR